MSEHSFVERPFLDQLAALGWQIVDQGPGVPTDPTASLRTSFREVILPNVFRDSLNAINQTEDGKPWLTAKQISDLREELLSLSAKSLVEANEAALKLLYRAQVDSNEVTGEQYPNVSLIDFEHPERNHFVAINQFRVDTPGAGKGFIIPDIVLFVNGIPLVVIECKDGNEFTSNPMDEAFRQLMRYSNQRAETKLAGLREGEPRLFHTNQLLIRTCGDRADFGTITATEEEFFFQWKDIYPEKYRRFDAPLTQVREQETLIQGMLPKETLLDLIRTCCVFMNAGGKRVKVMARYADAAFREFYRTKGAIRIPPRVAYFQAKMGVKSRSIRILDLKHRWASCTASGHLNFHWKCMMAPLTIIDYIVVHELAHLIHSNHSAAFWNEVDKVMPDFQQRKTWLRENGAGMDL